MMLLLAFLCLIVPASLITTKSDPSRSRRSVDEYVTTVEYIGTFMCASEKPFCVIGRYIKYPPIKMNNTLAHVPLHCGTGKLTHRQIAHYSGCGLPFFDHIFGCYDYDQDSGIDILHNCSSNGTVYRRRVQMPKVPLYHYKNGSRTSYTSQLGDERNVWARSPYHDRRCRDHWTYPWTEEAHMWEHGAVIQLETNLTDNGLFDDYEPGEDAIEIRSPMLPPKEYDVIPTELNITYQADFRCPFDGTFCFLAAYIEWGFRDNKVMKKLPFVCTNKTINHKQMVTFKECDGLYFPKLGIRCLDIGFEPFIRVIHNCSEHGNFRSTDHDLPTVELVQSRKNYLYSMDLNRGARSTPRSFQVPHPKARELIAIGLRDWSNGGEEGYKKRGIFWPYFYDDTEEVVTQEAAEDENGDLIKFL
uniref:Glycoprotein n=1 Tax=Caenorhabditis tropicalis TaxID=1561998 RepID=A0A1I7T8W6_9PELO